MARQQVKRLAMMKGTIRVNRMLMLHMRRESRQGSKSAITKAIIRVGMLAGSMAGVMVGGEAAVTAGSAVVHL